MIKNIIKSIPGVDWLNRKKLFNREFGYDEKFFEKKLFALERNTE